METKKIGELVSATAKRVTQWPERIGDVGVVKDTAIHDLDVMRFISGEDPVSVYAKMAACATANSKLRPNHAHLRSGKTAFIESNRLTPYKIRTQERNSSEAIMRLDYNSQ